MNTEERKHFWDVLLSLDGINIQKDYAALKPCIKWPQHLYRFRSVTTSSLDGLRMNRLYFSSADKYDDPFDSFLFINWDEVISGIGSAVQNSQDKVKAFDMIQTLTGVPADQLSLFFDSHSVQEWQQYGKNAVGSFRDFMQKNELSICFSEAGEGNGLNEVLWLKYANNHSGFAMEYDLADSAAFICGSKEKCVPCPAAKQHYPLYPMYYSNEKYDATDYAKAEMVAYLFSARFPQNAKDLITTFLPNMVWQRERIALIKHECHKYDLEWRMIYPNAFTLGNDGQRPFIVWRPSSVTLGMRIKQADENLVMALAQEAGIPRIYKCYIDNQNALDRKLIWEV